MIRFNSARFFAVLHEIPLIFVDSATVSSLYPKWIEFESAKSNSSNEKLSIGTHHILPLIGNLHPSEIDTKTIAFVLNTAYATRSEATVIKIRSTLRQFLIWCSTQYTIRPDLFSNVGYFLTKDRTASVPHPAISVRDVPRFFRVVNYEPTMETQAILFTILTASRIGNVVGSLNKSQTKPARWNDITENFMTWNIPAENMKCGKKNGNHLVPLSTHAREILRWAKEYQIERGIESEYVFYGMNYHRIERTLRLLGFVDKATGRAIHMHGFRSTFKTWGTEMGIDWFLTEIALHHQIDKLKYDRSQAMRLRRKMMERWDKYCFGLEEKW